tara:strand:- start:755 stop:1765 length:1011 start_codon:yes stop_codon:yes gene_type:complete
MVIKYISMREIKSKKNKNFIKKIFIKISRMLGYEIIDQDTLEFPTSYKYHQDTISVPGEKSVKLGIGELKISRKIKALDIIVKTCTNVHLVTQNKKRIFEKEKFEYTYRTINSLIKSSIYLKNKFKNINVKFTIVDTNSSKLHIDKILSKISNEGFEAKLLNVGSSKFSNDNMSSTMASIKESFLQAKNCEDLIYFVEDDYLHKVDSLSEMLFAYEKFSSIFQDEIFILSTDYPYLYKNMVKTNVLLGENTHWRTVGESLLTFLTSKKMVEKYFSQLIDMATNKSEPFEKNLHEIYEKEKCLSPIPSLSIHLTNVNSVFGLSPNVDFKDIWDKNKN